MLIIEHHEGITLASIELSVTEAQVHECAWQPGENTHSVKQVSASRPDGKDCVCVKSASRAMQSD